MTQIYDFNLILKYFIYFNLHEYIRNKISNTIYQYKKLRKMQIKAIDTKKTINEQNKFK